MADPMRLLAKLAGLTGAPVVRVARTVFEVAKVKLHQ
jgi:hypothetical protein